MKKLVSKIITLLLVCIFFLGGCAKMEPLTDADQEKCALYVAGIISKFNKQQNRGIVAVVVEDEEEKAKKEDGDDTEETPETPFTPTDINAPTADGGESELTGIIAIPGISFAYKGMNVSSDYGAEGGFLISPQPGNSYVSVTFTATNITSEEIVCDVQSRSLNFTAKLGEVTSAVGVTILPDDLLTYKEAIPGQGSVDLTVLFQFPTSSVSDLSGLELTCYKEGTRYVVPFKKQ